MNRWEKHRIIIFVIVVIFSLAVINLNDIASAGPYKDSAHGQKISRKVSNGYAIGNCYHCHEQHHAPADTTGSSISSNTGIYAAFKSEEYLCFGCHGNGGKLTPIGSATDDVESDMDGTSFGHGYGTGGNNVLSQVNLHRAKETTVATTASSPHVECTDCHNPHIAGTDVSGRHTVGTNLIESPGPLEGVDGVDFGASTNYPDWIGAGTDDPTIWPSSNPGTAQPYATATMEYQICFKCHSSANDYTDDFDGNPGGALEWTDVALEFNPKNAALHPVTTGLTAATNSSPLNEAQLIAPWNTNVGVQTMYCSDCHESSTTAPYGPHGSATRWMLRGTNTNWPFQSATQNGSATGTWAYLGGINDTTFCSNCHPDPSGSSSNNVHTTIDHQDATDGRCLTCHIRVPHGGKVSRLINASVNDSDLPSRYWSDGDGGGSGGFAPELQRFLQTEYRSYAGNASNCGVRTCHTGHSLDTGESW